MKRKKESKKGIFIAIFIAFVMIASIFGIIVGNQSNQQTYNGVKFRILNNLYFAKINGQEITFYYYPEEILYINVSPTIKQKVQDAYVIYLTFDPENRQDDLLYIDTLRFGFPDMDKIIMNGVIRPTDQYNMSIIGCENATQLHPVIFLNISKNTSIVEENYCIILNGQKSELLKVRDRFLYSVLGVIND